MLSQFVPAGQSWEMYLPVGWTVAAAANWTGPPMVKTAAASAIGTRIRRVNARMIVSLQGLEGGEEEQP